MASISVSLLSIIRSDAGDKLAKAELRNEVVMAYVVKCLRGNATEYRQGVEFAAGLKTKAGKAWRAGFTAIAEACGAAEPQRFAYVGKLSADVAAAIDAAAAPLALAFCAAFEEVMPSVKAEPTAEEVAAKETAAAERKAKAAAAVEAKAEARALELAKAAGMVDKETHAQVVALASATTADVDPSALVAGVVQALTAGALLPEEVEALRIALALTQPGDEVVTPAKATRSRRAAAPAAAPAH